MSKLAVMPLDDYIDTCNAIRQKCGGAKLTSSELALKIDEVYKTGRKNVYSDFWDAYQHLGNRRNYLRAFYQFGWNDRTYNPKYDIICDSNYASAMFAWADIKETKVPIKIQGNVSTEDVFLGCDLLETIYKLDIDEYTGTFNRWFLYCSKLKNLTILGEIKNNGFNVSDCGNLTDDSLNNIIGSLKEFGETDTLIANIPDGQQRTPIEIAKGTIEEGKEYTWSYYDALYGGWVVNDRTAYPSTSEAWITSTAGEITVNGKNYRGFMAEFLNYPSQNEDPWAIYVYEDGGKIMVYADKDGEQNGSADVIRINQIQLFAKTITLGVTNLKKLSEAEIASATQKGWSIV